MDEGLIEELYLYAKEHNIPFISITSDDKHRYSYCDRKHSTPSFYYMVAMLALSDKGQINNSVESALSSYTDTYEENIVLLDETDFGTPPDVILHFAEQCEQIKAYLETKAGPWLLCYEIKVDDTVEKKTVSPMTSFKQNAAYNIVKYLASYGDVALAAQEFTDMEMDGTRSDYLLFEKYL